MRVKVRYPVRDINSVDDIIKLMLKHRFVRDAIGLVKRDVCITPSLNNHGTLGTVYISISGSPPKGIAVLTFQLGYIANLLIVNHYNDEVALYQVRVSDKLIEWFQSLQNETIITDGV